MHSDWVANLVALKLVPQLLPLLLHDTQLGHQSRERNHEFISPLGKRKCAMHFVMCHVSYACTCRYTASVPHKRILG